MMHRGIKIMGLRATPKTRYYAPRKRVYIDEKDAWIITTQDILQWGELTEAGMMKPVLLHAWKSWQVETRKAKAASTS
jgi:hypothetical protein